MIQQLEIPQLDSFPSTCSNFPSLSTHTLLTSPFCPWNKKGAVHLLAGADEQSPSNHSECWILFAFLVGGSKEQQLLAQAPFLPMSCLQPPFNCLPSESVLGGKLMQISALLFSGIRISVGSWGVELASSIHTAVLSEKLPVRPSLRNHSGAAGGGPAGGPCGTALATATKHTISFDIVRF